MMNYKTEEIGAIAFARQVQLPDLKPQTISFQREILIGAEKAVETKIRPRSGQILP